MGRTAESDEALARLIEKYADNAALNIAHVLAFREPFLAKIGKSKALLDAIEFDIQLPRGSGQSRRPLLHWR